MAKEEISKFRGYDIKKVGNEFVFCDTGEPTIETWHNRPCGHCKKHNTPEGHDGCLGTLPFVINACCGHGNYKEAYLQLENKKILRGFEAVEKMISLMP